MNDGTICTDELAHFVIVPIGKDSLGRDEVRAPGIVRRLIEVRLPGEAGGEGAALAAAAACDDLYRDLSRWIGLDGCHALFTRSLVQTRTERPELANIRLRVREVPYVDGVAEALIGHDAASIAAALERMLIRLVELLGRLVGDDVAMKLMERSFSAIEGGRATFEDRQEEA